MTSNVKVANRELYLWKAAGYTSAEMQQLNRIVAERAFIRAVWPEARQFAQWQACGSGTYALAQYVLERTGLLLSPLSAEQLWRLFLNQPEPRSKGTIRDYLSGLPETLICKQCDKTEGPFHFDHVIPLRKGGRDSVTNLQVLCAPCNLKKGSSLDPNVIFIEFEIGQDE